MSYTFKDGNIVVFKQSRENVLFDISNEQISIQTDGCGGLLKYLIGNQPQNHVGNFTSWLPFINGKPLDPYMQKRVEMIGRKQTVFYENEEYVLSLKQFLSKGENAVR